jgi:hypothetical protein
VSITDDELAGDRGLIDVSGMTLDDLLTVAEDTLSTALDRVMGTPADCANSFQSSI